MFVSFVSVLYQNSVFRCFVWTETKQKQPKQTEKIAIKKVILRNKQKCYMLKQIRLLYGSGKASIFVNKIHVSGSQGLKNLRIGGSGSSSGRRQFEVIVSWDFLVCFLVSFESSYTYRVGSFAFKISISCRIFRFLRLARRSKLVVRKYGRHTTIRRSSVTLVPFFFTRSSVIININNNKISCKWSKY
jgi:hypothetical protein